ncbi:hypothetical protein BJ508DRAFT_335012 [Ascobolus immersus RN42]|uniref:Uncharacterized protein n=1 Tax=Ascobolus immersus RN42 TaxID=1160509 RepID=A0A3N4HIH9_ASCIM|nr:hypothetical protein BJ508DRAFT_335012 [Ascobolus immersus RN42]
MSSNATLTETDEHEAFFDDDAETLCEHTGTLETPANDVSEPGLRSLCEDISKYFEKVRQLPAGDESESLLKRLNPHTYRFGEAHEECRKAARDLKAPFLDACGRYLAWHGSFYPLQTAGTPNDVLETLCGHNAPVARQLQSRLTQIRQCLADFFEEVYQDDHYSLRSMVRCIIDAVCSLQFRYSKENLTLDATFGTDNYEAGRWLTGKLGSSNDTGDARECEGFRGMIKTWIQTEFTGMVKGVGQDDPEKSGSSTQLCVLGDRIFRAAELYRMRLLYRRSKQTPLTFKNPLAVFDGLAFFVCLFEDCRLGNEFYRTRFSWMQHMRSDHPQWPVSYRFLDPIPKDEKSLQSFRTPEKAKEHMNQVLMITNGSIDIGLSDRYYFSRTLERDFAKVFGSCPLCQKTEKEIIEEKLDLNWAPDDRMANHIVSHLEELFDAVYKETPASSKTESLAARGRHSSEGLRAIAKVGMIKSVGQIMRRK